MHPTINGPKFQMERRAVKPAYYDIISNTNSCLSFMLVLQVLLSFVWGAQVSGVLGFDSLFVRCIESVVDFTALIYSIIRYVGMVRYFRFLGASASLVLMGDCNLQRMLLNMF